MKTLLFLLAVSLALLFAGMKWAPVCTADSPHGPRIGGAILIQGCP